MPNLKPSYDHGANSTKLSMQRIGALLAETAMRLPDHEALVVGEQKVRWTWRELAERAEAFAAGLLALGLTPGDRVGVWSPNCAEWVIAEFALSRAGLICVTLNPAYRLNELEFALNKTGCSALIRKLRRVAQHFDAGAVSQPTRRAACRERAVASLGYSDRNGYSPRLSRFRPDRYARNHGGL
jgi:fatty-acyl-CoA synthase